MSLQTSTAGVNQHHMLSWVHWLSVAWAKRGRRTAQLQLAKISILGNICIDLPNPELPCSASTQVADRAPLPQRWISLIAIKEGTWSGVDTTKGSFKNMFLSYLQQNSGASCRQLDNGR
jgi:hypothetical protein